MKLSKITAASVALIAAVGIIAGTFSGCKKEEEPKSDSAYLTKVNDYSFRSNTADTAIPEYNTYHHVLDFLDACEIKDGSAAAPNGKVRKVLFIGFDGMRADALSFVLGDENNSKTGVSGIAELVKKGG